jgi:hypothetical protein
MCLGSVRCRKAETMPLAPHPNTGMGGRLDQRSIRYRSRPLGALQHREAAVPARHRDYRPGKRHRQ